MLFSRQGQGFISGFAAIAARSRAGDDGMTATPPPTITTSGSQTVAENAAFSLTLEAVETSVSWSIVDGDDASLFNLVGDELTMTAKDYENPADFNDDNIYYVVVRCTADAGGFSDLTIAVTVTDVVEGGADTTAPTITSSATFSQPENTPFSTTLTANETVTWSLVGGGDLAKYSLNGAVLSLPGQDYEIPSDANADRVYRVRVRATDTAGNFSEQVIDVTITNVDDSADPAADLFAAMSTPLSTSDQSAVRTAIDAMITEGIWTELDWFNFALADEQQSNLNWKNPGTSTGQRATETGTCTFTAYAGQVSNGTTGLMDTGTSESTSAGFAQDDCSMFVLLSSLGTGGATAGNTKARIVVNTNGTFTYRSNTTGDVTSQATGDAVGPFFYSWSRDGAGATRSYYKGAGESTATDASSTPTAGNFTYCSAGGAFCTHSVRCYGHGAALSAAQHATLHTILQTLTSSLNTSTSANALAVGTDPLTVGATEELVTS